VSDLSGWIGVELMSGDELDSCDDWGGCCAHFVCARCGEITHLAGPETAPGFTRQEIFEWRRSLYGERPVCTSCEEDAAAGMTRQERRAAMRARRRG